LPLSADRLRVSRLIVPPDRLPNTDLAIVQHFAEDAATPFRNHRSPQAFQGAIHPLARRRLAADPHAARADAQRAAAGSLGVVSARTGGSLPSILRAAVPHRTQGGCSVDAGLTALAGSGPCP